MKKIISLLLAVVMMLSLSVTAFAQASYSGPEYKTYTALGDSIPAGYGLKAYKARASQAGVSDMSAGILQGSGVYDSDTNPVSSTYPALVGTALGAKTVSLAHCGFRSTEIRALIDSTYSGDDYTQYICKGLSNITMEQFWALESSFASEITNSDLLTLNVGSNDTMTYALIRMNIYLSEKSTDSATSKILKDAMGHMGTLGVALKEMMAAADKMGETAGALKELSAAMLEGFNNFKTNFEKIVAKIYAMNPDVKLAVVGMYNPFRDVKLTDYSLVEIGKMADQFVGLMNTYMKVTCQYARQYTYVDVTDAQVHEFSAIANDDFWSNFVENLHPTEDGHAYMAQQILNALSGKDTSLIGSLTSGLKDLANKNKTAADKVLTQLKGLADKNTAVNKDIIAKLEDLLGIKITDPGFIEKVEDFLKNNKLPAADISAIKDALAGLMGNGSEADIGNDDTPLAGLAALNTTDHIAYVQGVGGGKFAPGADMTRAEAAQMLYNLLTADSHAKCDTSVNSFSDVSASAWYNTAVSTLANAGAISGYTDGTFRPAKKITRAELVNMVVGLVGQVDGAKSTFPDVAAGSWYYASAATAQAKGWIQGADGKYLPTKNMSRAEAVTFINSVLERSCDLSYVKSHSVTSFSDVSSGAWYYGAAMEAANGHDYAKSTSGAETWTGLK